MSLDTVISRRKFVRASIKGVATFTAAIRQLELIADSTQIASPRQITFEEAVASSESSVRQDYLKQLASRIGKPDCILDIVYDHDGSLGKQAEEQKQNLILEDTKIFKLYLDEFLELYIKPEEKDEIRQEVLTTSEGREKFRKYLLSFVPEQSTGYTHVNSHYFGQKSTIYITKKVFEDWKLENITKEVTYKASEEILTGILQHEFSHAEDLNIGIVLRENLKVDNSNLFDVHPVILAYISDIKAQLRSIDYTNKKFGQGSKAYAFLLHQLSNNVTEFNISISHTRGKLNPTDLDNKIYGFYISRMNELLEEARKIIGR